MMGTNTPMAAMTSWLAFVAVLSSISSVRLWWDRRQRAKAKAAKARATMAQVRLQKQRVLAELVVTGVLSHMMRNPYSRILPIVMEAVKM